MQRRRASYRTLFLSCYISLTAHSSLLCTPLILSLADQLKSDFTRTKIRWGGLVKSKLPHHSQIPFTQTLLSQDTIDWLSQNLDSKKIYDFSVEKTAGILLKDGAFRSIAIPAPLSVQLDLYRYALSLKEIAKQGLPEGLSDTSLYISSFQIQATIDGEEVKTNTQRHIDFDYLTATLFIPKAKDETGGGTIGIIDKNRQIQAEPGKIFYFGGFDRQDHVSGTTGLVHQGPQSRPDGLFLVVFFRKYLNPALVYPHIVSPKNVTFVDDAGKLHVIPMDNIVKP